MLFVLSIFKQHLDRLVLSIVELLQLFHLSSVCFRVLRIHGRTRSTNSRVWVLWQFFNPRVWASCEWLRIERIPAFFRSINKLELTRRTFSIFKYRRTWRWKWVWVWCTECYPGWNLPKHLTDSRLQASSEWHSSHKVLELPKPWQPDHQGLYRSWAKRTEGASDQGCE